MGGGIAVDAVTPHGGCQGGAGAGRTQQTCTWCWARGRLRSGEPCPPTLDREEEAPSPSVN